MKFQTLFTRKPRKVSKMFVVCSSCDWHFDGLTLKAPITTAADDKFGDIFPTFRRKYGMILHENRLPVDDSHEISCLICYFEKGQNLNLPSAAKYRWCFEGFKVGKD